MLGGGAARPICAHVGPANDDCGGGNNMADEDGDTANDTPPTNDPAEDGDEETTSPQRPPSTLVAPEDDRSAKPHRPPKRAVRMKKFYTPKTTRMPSPWTDELVLEFLEVYREHPCIWNSKHDAKGDQAVVNHAWIQIQKDLSVSLPMATLKRKRESLMTMYRGLLKKIKASVVDGMATFKPTWFAFKIMDEFLGDIYINLKRGPQKKKIVENANNSEDFIKKEVEDSEPDREMDYEGLSEILVPRISVRTADDANSPMTRHLKAAIAYQPPPVPPGRSTAEECALFAEMLACKMRAMDRRTRLILANRIDNLVFDFEMRRLEEDFAPEPSPHVVTSSRLESSYHR